MRTIQGVDYTRTTDPRDYGDAWVVPAAALSPKHGRRFLTEEAYTRLWIKCRCDSFFGGEIGKFWPRFWLNSCQLSTKWAVDFFNFVKPCLIDRLINQMDGWMDGWMLV